MHPMYAKEYDFLTTSGPPRKVICFHFMPRSGSNLLADLIYQTGLLGCPLEYFSKSNYKIMIDRLDILERLISARTTKNGIFSFKWNANFTNIDHAVKAYKHLSPSYHIFLDRRNRYSQARSYARAQKQNKWVNTKVKAQDHERTLKWKEIGKAMLRLQRLRKDTKIFLKDSGQKYLTIYFEDIISSPEVSIEKIFQFCKEATPSCIPKKAKVVFPS